MKHTIWTARHRLQNMTLVHVRLHLYLVIGRHSVHIATRKFRILIKIFVLCNTLLYRWTARHRLQNLTLVHVRLHLSLRCTFYVNEHWIMLWLSSRRYIKQMCCLYGIQLHQTQMFDQVQYVDIVHTYMYHVRNIKQHIHMEKTTIHMHGHTAWTLADNEWKF